MRRLLFLCLALALALPLYSAKPDELAGEKEEPKATEKKPDFVEPEGAMQVSLTRSAKAPQAPSIELPEAVVTGSGERKAASKRPDLGVMLDTSGGIKASPSEEDASKDQLGALGTRQTFEDLSSTSRPAYGQFRLLYGLANTFDGSAFWGEERQDFYYLLQAEHAFSDGGPSLVPVQAINQGSHTGLFAHGGWRQGSGQQWSAEASGRWRERLWTRSLLENPELQRSLYEASLSYEGAPQAELKHEIKLSASRASALLPGLGTFYTEGLVGIDAQAEKEFLTRQSRTLLKASAYARQLSQDDGARAPWLLGALLLARMEPWAGSRLSIGLSIDSFSPDPNALLFAPRAEFEQRLGATGVSVWARFAPQLELPTLAGSLFEKDPAFPGLSAKPAKDSINLEGGISAALKGNIGLELKAFVRQNEDALMLDDFSGSGLWVLTNARGMRVSGGELRETSPLGKGWSQQLSLRYEDVFLLDSPGLAATFAPMLSGQAGLDWAEEPWKAGIGLGYTAQRQARLAGGDLLPAYFDLRLSGEYAFSESLSFLAEARNLLAQPVQEFSGYAEPAPFVGLGAAYQF